MKKEQAELDAVQDIMREFERVEDPKVKNPCYPCLLDDKETPSTKIGQLQVPERFQWFAMKYVVFGVCESHFNLQAMTRTEKNILKDLEEMEAARKQVQ